ncbi:retrovirus-related pol polyprotein from transposon TNT 1-94 [Tanacetum coccineum]
MYSCNDHELKIIGIGIGSIMVKMHDGTVRTIRDVQHVEGLKKNLLSLGQLDDLGCKVEIQNKIMKIIKGARVLMRGEKVAANLYQLKREIMEEAEASVASHNPSHKAAHSLKFKTSNSRSVYVLELVHSDVWQAPVLSLGGAKYFFSFIDDYSRRCWVYPIKKKSDVFEVFKVYKARVELDSGKKIKCLRTNNRGEYTGDEFDTFCRQEGNKSLGKSFSAEVVNTACYVINHLPSTAVELKTPMEMWTGKPVNYSDLHISGIKGYRLWDPTAHKVVVSRDVVFMEDKSQENEEAAPRHEVNETNESQAPATRTLNRERRCPGWHSDYVMESNVAYCLLTEEGEPSTLQEALNNPDASFWKEAMQEEVEALHKNKT